jgi:ABC-2 type transport system permease protein
VAYAGFAQLIALRTRNVQTTNASFIIFFPLLFLTPNFVPFERLSQPMRAMARANPVSYIIVGLRSLVLEGWNAGQLLACLATILATAFVLTAASLATLRTYGD